MITELLLKRLKHSPVVAIQGVRQSGKSTLARDLFAKNVAGTKYLTFDQPSVREYAERNPESFLSEHESVKTLIIDEAQKVPKIFDAIKYLVDQKRRPGQFLLLGSTEFSKLMKIRESLTGRMSRIRMYPMIMAELLHKPVQLRHPFFLSDIPQARRSDLLKFLKRGGMPALFSIRAESEFFKSTEDWIALSIERDLQQIPTKKIRSEDALKVLRSMVELHEPEAGRIANETRLSPQKVKSILDALKTLFVIHEVLPHRLSTGKPRYYLCDPGIATAMGAKFQRQLETAFYLECFSKLNLSGSLESMSMTYYRTSKGSVIHGIVENDLELSALKLIPDETIDERELFVLSSLKDKLLKSSFDKKINLFALAGSAQNRKDLGIKIFTWECLA